MNVTHVSCSRLLTNKVPEKVLCIGRIKDARGLRGDLKITAFGELLDEVELPLNINTYSATGARDGFLIDAELCGSLKITAVQREKQPVISCAGIDNRDEAENLRGLYLGMTLPEARETFSGRDRTEEFLFEYVDLDVHSADGVYKGRVDHIYSSGNASWLSVSTEEGGEVLLPLNGPFIQRIDAANRRLIVENFDELRV